MRFYAILFAFFLGLLSSVGRGDTAVTTVADKNVTTAGTRVQLSSTNIYAYSVAIEAKLANTGKIYVGDVSVSSTRGHQLEPGGSYVVAGEIVGNRVNLVNLASIYIDSSVDAEGVKITYTKVTNPILP